MIVADKGLIAGKQCWMRIVDSTALRNSWWKTGKKKREKRMRDRNADIGAGR